MRGVYKHLNLWVSTYSNSNIGIKRITKYFATKKEAEKFRNEMESIHGRYSKKRKNFEGFENENFKVIGDTNENIGNGNQKVVVFNKDNQKYETRRAVDVVNGKITGKNLSIAVIKGKNGKHYTFNKRRKKYYFRIRLNKKNYSKGGFKTEKEVIEYRDKFMKEHNLI